MRPMTNDVNILRNMLRETGDLRLVKVIRKVKRYYRNQKRKRSHDKHRVECSL